MTYDDLAQNLKKYIEDIFSNMKGKVKRFTIFLFDIILRAIFCTMEFDKQKDNGLFYLIAFDNIEWLIGGNDIYDDFEQNMKKRVMVQENHLRLFMDAIKESILNLNEKLRQIGINFREKFVVVISVRDTTLTLFNSQQYCDHPSCVLEVSNWYDAEAIFNKKLAFIQNKSILSVTQNDVLYCAINTIMNDKSPVGLCLYNSITNMYNHNKRRIFQVLIDVLGQDGNIEVVSEYLNLWNQLENVSKEQYDAYKHLCRRAILRLLFNRFESRGLFDRFGVGGKNSVNDFSTYARKILTFLYRKNPYNKRDDYENYIGMIEVAKNVIKPYRTLQIKDIDKDDIPQLSKMLYFMSDMNMTPHQWAPLIEIIIDTNDLLSEATIINALSDISSLEKSKIKITDAGRFYAYINADFEYFASRYVPDNRHPLFTKANLSKTKDGKSYECIEIIKTVRERAFNCINILMNQDKNFFYVSDTNNMYRHMYNQNYLFKTHNTRDEVPHPLRIIRQHRGYLKSFKIYVENTVNNEDKTILLEKIEDQIAAYEKYFENLINEDKKNGTNYFNGITNL